MEDSLFGFIGFFAAHILFLMGALIIWTVLWLKKVGFDIYGGTAHIRRKSQIGKIQYVQRIIRIHEFFRYWKELFSKLCKFDSLFWLGISSDVYLYLLLQRALIRLCLIIFVVSLAFAIFFNLFEETETNFDDAQWRHVWLFRILFGSSK